MVSLFIGAGIVLGLALVEEAVLALAHRFSQTLRRVDTVTELVVALLIIVSAFLTAKHGSFGLLLLGVGFGGVAVWGFDAVTIDDECIATTPDGRCRQAGAGRSQAAQRLASWRGGRSRLAGSAPRLPRGTAVPHSIG